MKEVWGSSNVINPFTPPVMHDQLPAIMLLPATPTKFDAPLHETFVYNNT